MQPDTSCNIISPRSPQTQETLPAPSGDECLTNRRAISLRETDPGAVKSQRNGQTYSAPGFFTEVHAVLRGAVVDVGGSMHCVSGRQPTAPCSRRQQVGVLEVIGAAGAWREGVDLLTDSHINAKKLKPARADHNEAVNSL
jgi:hypothetical protein